MAHVVHDVVWAVLTAACVIVVILLYIATRHGLRLVWLPRLSGRERYSRRPRRPRA